MSATTGRWLNVETFQNLRTGLRGRSASSDRKFTEAEARHIMDLVTSPSEVEVVVERQPGMDGETYTLFGIRRRDGVVPTDPSIQFVYTAWINNYENLRFWQPDPMANELFEALGGKKK
jgi:hypothetical protein